MLNRIIESLIINTVNGVARRAPRSQTPPPDSPPPADQVLIGQTIPSCPSQPSETITLDPAARRRHLYVLGATGTGKTNLIMRLIADDIAARRTFCVVDLRGDLVDRVLTRLAADGAADLRERLLVVDLRDENSVVGLNPLAGDGDPFSRAFQVLSVLKAQSDSWGVQLEETLRNCLVVLAETGWSMLEIEPLLSNAGFRAEVMSSVTDSYARSFFERYESLSEDKKMAWSLPVLNKVTPLLAIPQLRLMFGQRRPLSMRDLIDQNPGRVILVSLAVDRLHHAAYLVGGLFVSVFQSAVMARVDTPEADRIPVSLYIDEFETMASDRFEAIVAEGRQFGLGLTLSHQNLSQLPPGLRDMLRNNVHTQFYFQTGATDASSLAAEVVSELPRDAVRAALIAQGVGEAFLIRRGSLTVRVQVAHAPDPNPGRRTIQALCTASRAQFGISRVDAQAELSERERRLAALKALPPINGPSRQRATGQHSSTQGRPPMAQTAADAPPATGRKRPPQRHSNAAHIPTDVSMSSENASSPSAPSSAGKPDPAFEVRHGKKPGTFRPDTDE